MECCDEIMNLGCVGSCTQELSLDHTIDAGAIENYKLKAFFNGSSHCIALTAKDDTELQFNPSTLNEDYLYELRLYEEGNLIKCFKVKTNPEICK